MLLSEAEFWERMARRVSEEFAGLAGPALRYLWCDGLIPESYALDGARPTIGGRAWIGDVGNARDQELWTFELVVGHFAATRDPIPWATLLPHHDATHWLGVDHAAKRLYIDPGGERQRRRGARARVESRRNMPT